MNDSMMQTPDSQGRRLSPGRIGVALALLLIVLGVFSVTIIESGQTAVMIRAGSDQSRVIAAPGIYLRVPFVERVWLIDTRLKTTEQIEPQSLATADQQTLSVSGWMAWRVTDPARFQAATAAEKSSLDERLRKTLGDAFALWVATQPAAKLLQGQVDAMPQTGLADLNQRLSALGLEATQAGLRQVGLSEAANAAIYARMSAVKNRNTRQLIDGLAADERQLVALQRRQQTQVLDEAYRSAQQNRQGAEQQLLAVYARQYGSTNRFAEILRNPPRPAEKSDNERQDRE
ncbi:MAG: SPFH domain-containing protein [Fluviibacter sp.]